MPGPSYRADIDGLRAVAILSVLSFHLRVLGFSGGYVGVDVFFVISGYLITGLVYAEQRRETFALSGFYLRRVRRLAPALIAMSLASTVAAVFVLYPEDMRSFAGSLAVQFVALQNVFFLADGEYFRNSETKFLLHTWTLAVEEQFYLFWPLALLLMRRLPFRRQMLLITTAMAISFSLNVVSMRLSPKASFFLLPQRAWELGIGGTVALLEAQNVLAAWTARRRAVASVVGLLAIAASVGWFTANTPFPGRAALLPVLGAALVVAGGIGGTTPVGRLLSHPAMVHVGLISYPLYLWHWPLIALGHHLHHARTIFDKSVIIAASFALAEATYRFIETPIRSRKRLPTARGLLAAAGAFAVPLAGFGVHAYLTDGAAYRFSPIARSFLTAPFSASGDRCGFLVRVVHPSAQVCALHTEPSARQRLLIWGNSHADMWSGLFIELGRKNKVSVFLNARNCRATVDSRFCGKGVQDEILRFISSEHITDVVLASAWYGQYGISDAAFEDQLSAVVDALSARAGRIWLVVDTPSGRELDPITEFERNRRAPQFGAVSLQVYDPRRRRERELFRSLSARHGNVGVIDPSVALCDDVRCPGGSGAEVWYRDTHHVTNAGARAAAKAFFPIFTDGTTPRVADAPVVALPR